MTELADGLRTIRKHKALVLQVSHKQDLSDTLYICLAHRV